MKLRGRSCCGEFLGEADDTIECPTEAQRQSVRGPPAAACLRV